MCVLLKLHYAKFDVFGFFFKVIEEKPWGSTPSGKGRVKSAQSCVRIMVLYRLFCIRKGYQAG